jgi:hypothetical protein
MYIQENLETRVEYDWGASSVEESPSEANSFSARQDVPAFRGARSYLIMFTTAMNLRQFWAIKFQFTPSHLIQLISILISSHLDIPLPNFLFQISHQTSAFLSPDTSFACTIKHFYMWFKTKNVLKDPYKIAKIFILLDILFLFLSFRFLRPFAKLRKATISFVVCLSVRMEQLGFH